MQPLVFERSPGCALFRWFFGGKTGKKWCRGLDMRILPGFLMCVLLLLSQGAVVPVQAQVRAPMKKGVRSDWILKAVDFREATLTEALEYLRQKTQEQDPQRRGANILLGPGGVPAKDKTLTLKLNQVPFSQVLKYVADLVGLEVRMDGDVYVLDAPKRVPANP